jgi:hypothetical protein
MFYLIDAKMYALIEDLVNSNTLLSIDKNQLSIKDRYEAEKI